MNLTLSVDDRVVKEARRVAESMGKSLNQMVREYLEHLTDRDQTERDIEEFRQLTSEGLGRSGSWRFDREELHER